MVHNEEKEKRAYLHDLVHKLEDNPTIHLSRDLVFQGDLYHKIPI